MSMSTSLITPYLKDIYIENINYLKVQNNIQYFERILKIINKVGISEDIYFLLNGDNTFSTLIKQNLPAYESIMSLDEKKHIAFVCNEKLSDYISILKEKASIILTEIKTKLQEIIQKIYDFGFKIITIVSKFKSFFDKMIEKVKNNKKFNDIFKIQKISILKKQTLDIIENRILPFFDKLFSFTQNAPTVAKVNELVTDIEYIDNEVNINQELENAENLDKSKMKTFSEHGYDNVSNISKFSVCLKMIGVFITFCKNKAKIIDWFQCKNIPKGFISYESIPEDPIKINPARILINILKLIEVIIFGILAYGIFVLVCYSLLITFGVSAIIPSAIILLLTRSLFNKYIYNPIMYPQDNIDIDDMSSQ